MALTDKLAAKAKVPGHATADTQESWLTRLLFLVRTPPFVHPLGAGFQLAGSFPLVTARRSGGLLFAEYYSSFLEPIHCAHTLSMLCARCFDGPIGRPSPGVSDAAPKQGGHEERRPNRQCQFLHSCDRNCATGNVRLL